ncbi:MAG: DUF5719 family protein, partial [Frankia sp.]
GPAPAAAGRAGSPAAVPVPATSVVCPNLLAGYTGPGSGRAVRVALDTVGPHPGGPVTRATIGRSGVTTVTASGAGAGGVTTTVTATGTGKARAASRALCVAPTTTTWFAGPGTGAGVDPLLTLTNPGSVPARADIAVITNAGPAGDDATGDDATGDDSAGDDAGGDDAGGDGADPMGVVEPGVGIPAGSTVTVRLAALAPEAAATAVRVTVREGRLAASLLDRDSRPGPARNVAAVPPGAPPSRAVLIPGEASGPGRRVLVIAAPIGDATVRVEQVGPGSRYSPVGLDAVVVPAGTVTRLDLGRAAPADGAVLVTVTAGAPVLAALGLTSADATASARTWLASIPVRAGSPPAATTVVAIPAVPAGTAGEVVVATGSGDGRARLGTGAPVPLPAGRTVTIALPFRYRGGMLTIMGPGSGSKPGGQSAPPVAVAQILRGAGAVDGPAAGPRTALVLPPAVDTVNGVIVLEDPRAAFQR